MDNKVVIYSARGKKIGEIRPYQKYWDYLKTTEIGLPHGGFGNVGVSHKIPVWSNPEAIVLWAWRQSISCVDDLRNNKLPSICIVCGNKSINLKRGPLRKKAWMGVHCSNPNCKMYNVLIPYNMFYIDPNEDIPWDKIN
jgi:hypothetical protein